MDTDKIKKIVKNIIANNVKKKDPKSELKELQKAHDSLVEATIKLINLNGTFSSNLTKDEHIALGSHIKKVESETAKIKEIIISLKF